MIKLAHFYKVEDGKTIIGTGTLIPKGFKEYDPKNPPEEVKQLAIESKWNEIRDIRNELLKETDVYMLIDKYEILTDEQKKELKIYRQRLRDIPQSFKSPEDVKFPEKPKWL